ncbi:MAG: glycosyltransferase [Pseudomonadota bacterium]
MITFAVLLCTYNGEQFLKQQLQSLAEQSKLPDEIHVHDWGSSDDTIVILDEWALQLGSEIQLSVTQHDRPLGAARGYLLGLVALLDDTQASHILFCDQDDMWFPNKLACYQKHLQSASPNTDLLFSDLQLIDEDDQVLEDSFYRRRQSPYRPLVSISSPDLGLVNPAVGMSMCLSVQAATRLARYADAPWPMHDWAAVLLCRIFDKGATYIPEPLGAYRQHAENVRGASSVTNLEERFKRLKHRRQQVKSLAAWCDALPEEVRARARSLFPTGRLKAAGLVLRSRNLRVWFRIFYAVVLVVS